MTPDPTPAAAILETALYAPDLEAAERFYTTVFGLPVIAREPGRHVFLRCGPGVLLIFDPQATRAASASPIPRHGAEGAGHVCFRARDAAEMALWQRRFRALGVAIESDHTWTGGARSLYVRDPAGNSVEVAEARLWGIG